MSPSPMLSPSPMPIVSPSPAMSTSSAMSPSPLVSELSMLHFGQTSNDMAYMGLPSTTSLVSNTHLMMNHQPNLVSPSFHHGAMPMLHHQFPPTMNAGVVDSHHHHGMTNNSTTLPNVNLQHGNNNSNGNGPQQPSTQRLSPAVLPQNIQNTPQDVQFLTNFTPNLTRATENNERTKQENLANFSKQLDWTILGGGGSSQEVASGSKKRSRKKKS